MRRARRRTAGAPLPPFLLVGPAGLDARVVARPRGRDPAGATLVLGARSDEIGGTDSDHFGPPSGAAVVYSIEDCILDLALGRDRVRAGEELTVGIRLEPLDRRARRPPRHRPTGDAQLLPGRWSAG